MPESHHVEYKSRLTDKFERSVVAFLNYSCGGRIYIGVDDEGNSVGVVDADMVQQEIVDRIKNNILPTTLVEIFSNRIVITSHGGLPDGLSLEDFYSGCSSPRNRELMRVFRDMDLVEQIGSGMNRILAAYDRSIFKFTSNFMMVTLPVVEEKNTKKMDVGTKKICTKDCTKNCTMEDAINSVGETKNGDFFDGVNDGVNIKLDIFDRLLLDLIQSNPRITVPEMTVKIGKSQSFVERRIKILKATHLRRIASDKTGQWKIVNPESETSELLEAVVEILRAHPSATRDEIAAQLNVSPRTVSQFIKTLVESKRISRTGGRCFGRWIVADE